MKAAACPWFDALSDRERSVALDKESGTSDLSQAHGRAAHRSDGVPCVTPGARLFNFDRMLAQ